MAASSSDSNDSKSASQIIGRWDSLAISIGIVIGVGIFRVPSEVAQQLHSGTWIIIAWIIGGLFSFLGALCYAELASIFPKSGGDYIYLRESYGKVVAFLFAWSELLITRTGSVAAIAILFGEYGCALFSLDPFYKEPMAFTVIAILTLCNLAGLKQTTRLQNFFTGLKLTALMLMIACGFFAFRPSATQFEFINPLSLNPKDLMYLGVALVPILWTYGGWRDNVFLAGETKEAKSSLPFALLATCIVVTLVYCSMNLLYLWFLNPGQMAKSELIASDVLSIIFGPIGAKIFQALIVLFGLGVVNALLLTGSRIAHAMADDNPLFGMLCKTNAAGTPVRALVFNGIWSCVLVRATGQFDKLLYFTGLAVWVFFAMVAIGIIVLRKKGLRETDTFVVPLYPWVPIIVAIVSGLLAASTFIHDTNESIVGTAIVLSGIPIYYLQKFLKKTV